MTKYSNSGIATFQRCPLAYQYEQVLKLRRIDEDSSQHHLIFGAAIHKALEVLYTKNDLKLAKETMKEYYPVQLDTEDLAKTTDNACYALEKYWEHYDQDKDWEVVAVEGREFTDSGFGIKPDLVVKDDNDNILLCDHKTTGSYLNFDYFSQFDPNAQITHYINWCREKYGHCDGFIVNAIRFAFLKRASKDRAAGFNVEFERQVFQRTKVQIERTLRATEETIKDIDRCRETGFWRPQEQPNSCKFCLAGETEVITDQGAFPIRDLVPKATLLLPLRANSVTKIQSHGKWTECEVKSFGKQSLLELVLGRGRSTKVVYCTAEHNWVLQHRPGFRITTQLEKGDRLAVCSRPSIKCSGSPVIPSSVGIAHGFVFGDGHLEGGAKRVGPAAVVFYGEKDKEMMQYFHVSSILPTKKNGKNLKVSYGLPRTWKEPPALGESRTYLLGWLAGYFAADGWVGRDGKQAMLSSASRDSLRTVRAICDLLGIYTSPIQGMMRTGFGKRSWLFSLTIYTKSLPESFWLLAHHKSYIQNRKLSRNANLAWTVRSVSTTKRTEEVFCATVPDGHRFTLADNLVTGNCSYRSVCSAGWSWEEDSELILNNWRQICDQPISETEEHCQLDLNHNGPHSPLYQRESQEEFQVEV